MHKPVNGEQKGGYSLVHVVFFGMCFEIIFANMETIFKVKD
jgi:hypothetical protein